MKRLLKKIKNNLKVWYLALSIVLIFSALSATFFFAFLFIFLFIFIASVVLENSSDSYQVYPKSHGYITGNKAGKRGGRYNERISKDEKLYRQYY